MRRPKPFFRKFTKSLYAQIGGKQINLGRDKSGHCLRSLGEQFGELVVVGRTGASTGKECVSGRRADRAGDEGVVEAHTLASRSRLGISTLHRRRWSLACRSRRRGKQ